MNDERWRRTEELFHAALDFAPEARTAFLDANCEDADLRREVDVLLLNEKEAGSFLESPVIEELTASIAAAGLRPGRQFGPHRIVSRLGAGGMGEVYRAHDDELDRDVAIKILPSEFARDPDRMARFRREARTLASLNHPNIAAIYGLEESDDVGCLVLELVEGETLRGPLPVAMALDYAHQVAQALETSHRKGIIHRDLKPANVKVTPEGKVKVLDFGLAKALGDEHDEVRSSTTTPFGTVTLTGHLIGTPGYMSPEQARGKALDNRSDIWAFGCLLYELLTGKRAFGGETAAATIANVLEGEPDWDALPPKTPSRIRDLLRHCLHKDVALRVDDIAVARTAIEQIQQVRRSPRAIIAMVAAGVVVIAALAGLLQFTRRAAPSPLRRYAIPLPPNAPVEGALALSNDARRLVYKSSAGAPLYLRKMDTGEVTPIAGTEDGDLPFFSPDGEWVGFYSEVDGAIKKVALSGGSPITIDKVPQNDSRSALVAGQLHPVRPTREALRQGIRVGRHFAVAGNLRS